jgi:hypothetical protein
VYLCTKCFQSSFYAKCANCENADLRARLEAAEARASANGAEANAHWEHADTLQRKLAAAENARDKQSRQFDDYMKSLGTITLGINAEVWDAPSAHGNDRLRWAVLIAQKLEELKTDRREQAEALWVLKGELRNIADAKPHKWASGQQGSFQLWAQSRARWAIDTAAAAVKEASGGNTTTP